MDNTETANIRLLQNVKEITDFDASELDVYARLTEAQLLNKGHWMEDMSRCLFW